MQSEAESTMQADVLNSHPLASQRWERASPRSEDVTA
jgi:hypothetical protein